MIFDDHANARIGHDYQGNTEPAAEKWYPKMAIDPFVLCHAEECEVIHNDFRLMVRKRSWGESRRDVRPLPCQGAF